MGRVRSFIIVGRVKCWALFDSGAENTYVVTDIAKRLERIPLKRKRKMKLGGKVHKIEDTCILIANVRGKQIEVPDALVIDRIGRDHRKGREFEVLIGAHAMQNWGIELKLKSEKLDLSYYPGEFVEFIQ